MKKITITTLVIAATVFAAVMACNSSNSKSTNNEGIEQPLAISQDSLIKRGEYLVTIMAATIVILPRSWDRMGQRLIPKGYYQAIRQMPLCLR